MKATMLLFLGALSAIILQAQTLESGGAKLCMGQRSVPSDVEKTGAGEGDGRGGVFGGGKVGKALSTSGAKIAMAVDLPEKTVG